MRVLITGASGLLGKYLARTMPDADFTWYTTMQPWTRHRMNVTDPAEVAHVFAKVRPQIVIHGATIGDVDWCEKNYSQAESTIVGGAMNVLMAAKEYKSKVVYLSTNAVFGGDNPPYAPDSPRRPVNRYGVFRKRAEDIIASYRHEWAIIRLFLLYGWEPSGARDNWASRMARGTGPWSLVNDRWWQPTYATDAAQAVSDLLGNTGMWHVMGRDRVTLAEFGQAVSNAFTCGEVNEIISGVLPRGTAPRPVDAGYDPEATNTVLLPGIEDGLARMFREEYGYYPACWNCGN